MILSVVIPAFNEEKRLPETLKKVRNYLVRQDFDFEVIIVDDGSRDETFRETKYQIKHWPNFRIISYKPNRGKGFAVKTGMLAAKGEWRLLMDADNSTDISEIEKLFNFVNTKFQIACLKANSKQIPNSKFQKIEKLEHCDLNENCKLEIENLSYDIIIGSRYLNKDSIKIKQPLSRRIVSRLGNWLIRIILGIKAVDTQCGFKLFSAEASNRIFPLQTIDRWGFDMEVLAIAIRKEYEIKEVPVNWYDAEGSQVKKSAAWKTLKELFLIKWNILTGKYSND